MQKYQPKRKGTIDKKEHKPSDVNMSITQKYEERKKYGTVSHTGVKKPSSQVGSRLKRPGSKYL